MDLYSVKNQTLTVRLRSAQMTASTVSKIFNVFPHSIVLVGEDGTVATPDDNGEFNLYDMSTDVIWSVNGDSSKPGENMPRPSTSYAYQQPNHGNSEDTRSKWKPLARHKPPGVSKQDSNKEKRAPGRPSGSSWTKTIEICRFDCSDMAIKKTLNLPVTLTNQTSSVTGVGDIVSAEAFGGDTVVILDSENLRIPDSVGTRGKHIRLR